jgi:hypothetical protein
LIFPNEQSLWPDFTARNFDELNRPGGTRDDGSGFAAQINLEACLAVFGPDDKISHAKRFATAENHASRLLCRVESRATAERIRIEYRAS